MTDFGGDFTVPESYEIPGSWIVRDWAEIVVSVNKLPIDGLMEVDVSRDLNVGSGACTIKVSDPDRYWYDLLQPQDEIEVFMMTSTTPQSGRKIWGGFVDHSDYGVQSGEQLTIYGKEYISRLQSQTYDGTFTGATVYTALTTILGTQADFTYEGVPASLTALTTVTIKNDTIYNGLKQICDQSGTLFWINPGTRDFTANPATQIIYSPDLIMEGVNFLRQSSVNTNSEYLTNQLTVNYNGGSVTTAPDAASQAAFGVFSRAVSVGNLSNATPAAAFGATVVNSTKTPSEGYQLECQFLPYTDPGEFIQTSIPTLNLNGAFQVLSVAHVWLPGQGIKTTVELNTQYIDPSLYIANVENRLKLVEQAAYVP